MDPPHQKKWIRPSGTSSLVKWMFRYAFLIQNYRGEVEAPAPYPHSAVPVCVAVLYILFKTCLLQRRYLL